MQTLSLEQATREQFRAAAAVEPNALPRPCPVLDRAIGVLLAETFLAALSYTLTVLLFADARGTGWALEAIQSTLPLVVALRLIASISTGLYRLSVLHASSLDAISILKAVALSSFPLAALIEWRARRNVPVAIVVMDSAFVVLLWMALHFGARILHVRRAVARRIGKRAVIVGAGDAGISVLRELALDPACPSLPVALVDDDPQKQGRAFCGVPVLGGTTSLAKIAAQTCADEIIVCIPSATRSQMHDILDASRSSNLPVRSLPSLADILRGNRQGRASRHDLRHARIEDLLQREEVPIDARKARQLVEGKTVAVTGAGGSIGSELCRQIAAADPAKLILIEKTENSLFYIDTETAERLGRSRVKPCLHDLVDRDGTRSLLIAERPQLVFHAAAHKHVGMLELNPEEAFRNNVLGARNVAEAALECGAARFVNISTDKAVSPRNHMGLSKKLTELCIQELALMQGNRATRFANVRFGNVAGSTGSVIRLFWDQIQKGGPIRVTDPRAVRYFMSVPEAVHLILRAAALARGGETFVLEMGEPLNICELAKTMTLFAGLKPEIDIAIEFTGLREGEKIAEALWEPWERPVASGADGILEIRGGNTRAQGTLAKIAEIESLLNSRDTQALLAYVREKFVIHQPDIKPKSSADRAAVAAIA